MTGGHPEAGPSLSLPSGQEPQPERGLWRIISFWAGHFVFGCGFILLIIGILLAYTGGGPASIQQVNVLRVSKGWDRDINSVSTKTSPHLDIPIAVESLLACSRQLAEQVLGLFQIERVEAFSEPAVDRSEQVASLLRLPLIAPEPRHARGGAQLPGFRLLCPRYR
jgi:hypothetical protein